MVFVVWVPELGGQEKHVPAAAKLIADSRAIHFWDGNSVLGKAYQQILKTPGTAWDVYLVFAPETQWTNGPPPKPVFWMHQLSKITHAPRLDAQVLGQEMKRQLSLIPAGAK